VWRVPLGEFPELTKKGIPPTGTESYGGPLATAGGLVFIAATRDEMIRAFDKATGKIVWQYQLPCGRLRYNRSPMKWTANNMLSLRQAGRGTEARRVLYRLCAARK